jgi:uncharacterized protein YPO0396
MGRVSIVYCKGFESVSFKAGKEYTVLRDGRSHYIIVGGRLFRDIPEVIYEAVVKYVYAKALRAREYMIGIRSECEVTELALRQEDIVRLAELLEDPLTWPDDILELVERG